MNVRDRGKTGGCYDPPVQYSPKKLLDGTNILVASRVGAEEREWIAFYLGTMWAAGFLNEQEYDARRDRAFGSVTREDLNALIMDLPLDTEEWRQVRRPLIAAQEKPKAPDVIEPKPRVPLLLMLIFAIMTILFGGCLVATPGGNAMILAAGAGSAAIGMATLIREIPRM